MTRRFATRWPSPKRTLWRTPQTRRGWLITIALAGAALASSSALTAHARRAALCAG
jgi:hypothetical protein